jgi:hypothetical protein
MTEIMNMKQFKKEVETLECVDDFEFEFIQTNFKAHFGVANVKIKINGISLHVVTGPIKRTSGMYGKSLHYWEFLNRKDVYMQILEDLKLYNKYLITPSPQEVFENIPHEFDECLNFFKTYDHREDDANGNLNYLIKTLGDRKEKL